MDDYIDVRIDIFEHSGQRARVRKNLTVRGLIEEILKEFDDIGADTPDKYILHLKGTDRPLNPNHNLVQLDIQPQDELVLEYLRQTLRQMLDPAQYAVLEEDTTGKQFDIQWQPALIGRPNNEVDHNIMLAANLLLLPNGMTVSRSHAQITVTGGRYYIEPLAENNPVFLNKKELPFGAQQELRSGDRLAFGRSKLSMTFRSREQPTQRAAAARPTAPRTEPQSVAGLQSQASLPHQPDQPPEIMATRISAAMPGPAHLVIEAASNPDLAGQTISLANLPLVLGRSLPALSSEISVSRRHAEVNFDESSGKYTITDLQSTNGVALNGQAIAPSTPHNLTPGMKIALGQLVVVRFEGYS
jgi:pSer/pThr/pTyr-binding forkhead associated (FHA) protein